MKRLGMFVLLCCGLSATATAASLGEIIGKMIGSEYVSTAGDEPFLGIAECSDEGGSVVTTNGTKTGFGEGTVLCGKHRILVLEEQIGMVENRYPRWRIRDAIVLPALDRYATEDDLHVRQLWHTGACTLDGRRDTTIEVLLKWGKGDTVTAKNGVLAAWGFDTERGKIVSLDTSRIECTKPTPP